MTEAIEQFRAAILAAGMTPPDEIIPDGNRHRFSTNGRRSDDSGWYVLHLDGVPAGVFGSWREGFSQQWCCKTTGAMTQAERDAHRQKVKGMRQQREAETIARQQEAAQLAAQRWQAAIPATEHHYLTVKGVKAYGVKQEGVALLIPMLDSTGNLHSLQVIDPQGSKRFQPGGRVKGCYHAIGNPEGVLIVCEGYATGATIHEATGQAVAVAFSAGNLLPVALSLNQKYPALQLILAADDDWKTEGNPGMNKATEAARAVGGWLAVPMFPADRPDKATDFNDLHKLAGIEAVKACMHAAQPATAEKFTDLHQDGKRMEDHWPDPEPLVSFVAAEPYPLEVLPETIRAAVEEVQAFVKAPVAMVATSALSALSMAAQALFDVRRAEKLTGPIGLFTLVIADSGERKTTCDEFFLSAIQQWEHQQGEAMRPALELHKADMDGWNAEREGLLSAIKNAARKPGKVSIDTLKRELANLQSDKPVPPRIPRLIYSDITPEELGYQLAKGWPSAAIASSEAGAVLGSHAMAGDSAMRNMARLNDLWSGQAIQSDRRTAESWKARCARLTVGLQVQESTLRSFFDKSAGLARGTGFLARFLVAWPESTQGTRMFSDPSESWPHLARYHQAIERILSIPVAIDDDGALNSVILPLTVQAKAEWVAYHDEVEKSLRMGGDHFDVRDVASKSADNAGRLGTLFHIFEHGDGAVSQEAMQAGCMVAAWHLHESRRFFGQLAMPIEQADAIRVIRWAVEYGRAQDNSVVTTRNLQRYGPVRQKERLDAALRELHDHHHVRLRTEGRSKLVEINPAMLKATAT